MKPMRTERLILRNWEDRDRELFFRINSEDRVMEFFPFRRDRAEANAFMDHLRAGIAACGYGFTAAEIAETGECIGFVGIKETDLAPFVPKGRLEIGWRLAPEFWGKGYVTEASRRWLDFAFEELDAPEVASFAVWNNRRSLAVMQRLGMRLDGAFDHPHVPDTHPQFRRHILYRLSRDDWARKRSAIE
ncbi:GNAT family N-acetyltransferase [Arvimicrobium flavum]|uniref:GNAT family N-acetyltransferase n=1 Tax=Arvimicrobium flavum TaxID=3393320 RepID=UPI00237AF008|nr:GNAT family N-acetyltransferase [Mesorhizobium shangrilense]